MKNPAEKYRAVFGDCKGLVHASAPGRVNLIGEHTDYNGGFVMPVAIDRGMHIFFRPARGKKVRLWSENYGEMDEFDLEDIRPSDGSPWANYSRGVARAMSESGFAIRPIDAVLYGEVPIGAGLSSSAALEVATALALSASSEAGGLDKKKLALACQKAENEFVGVNCGIMDQFVSIHAVSDSAVFLDCRSLDYALLPLDADRFSVVVANTMVEHELGASAYNDRRATCEMAARKINEMAEADVKHLRDVSPDMLELFKETLTSTEYRRARHVVGENNRVLQAAGALKNGDYARFGELMVDSHRSLRDDYEVSCGELDTMVDIAMECEGVLGARMTGAGFGGCTVNLVEARRSAAVSGLLKREYERRTGIKPDVFNFKAAGGACLSEVNFV